MELDNTPSAASETNDSDNLFGQSPPEASRQPSPEPQEEAPAPVNDAAPAESSSAAYAERQRIKSQAVYNQIHKLNGTDIKLSKLLQIASEAMEAVHPTHREPGGDPASMWSHETTSQQAKDKADEYYALLNEIQIELRHTIRALRRNKVSVLPVTRSQQQTQLHGNVANGAVHPPNSKTHSSGLGLGGTRMQNQAWKDIRLGLQQILDGLPDNDQSEHQQSEGKDQDVQQQS